MVEFEDFFRAMMKKIRKAAVKRGDSWEYCDIDDLRERLKMEYCEWRLSIYASEEADELIDVANQAMLLWIRLQREKEVDGGA